MTFSELKAEAFRRLEHDHLVACESPRVRLHCADDFMSFESRYTLTLDDRPFVSWSRVTGYSEIHPRSVIWHFDEIGQPDLSFKGINKFKGRWEGENA